MSHQLDLAIALPEQPLLFAAPVGVVVLLLAIVVFRKRRAAKASVSAWTDASDELGIELIDDGSDLGPTVKGKVNSHAVTIEPASRRGFKNHKVTRYGVEFAATGAPEFVLVKRVRNKMPTVNTGHLKFDTVVSVQTKQPELLSEFLTAPRRAAILRLLSYWPSAEITNRHARLTTPGIEQDADKLVDSVCHLVAAAETFDRLEQAPDVVPLETRPATVNPSNASATSPPEAHDIIESVTTSATTAEEAKTSDDFAADVVAELGMDEVVAAARAIYEGGLDIDTDPAPETDTTGDEMEPVAATEASTQNDQCVNGDVLTDVRLDEISVLGDLFNSGRGPDGIMARFHQLYQGRAVTWTGEVLRVGATDDGSQRIAALIGSADGQNPGSGRVVALTAVGPEPALNEGDVVAFSGSLVNLDAAERLFQIA